MRRLYLKIYLTVVAVLVLLVLIAGGVWRFGAAGPPGMQAFEIAGELTSGALPGAGEPQAVQQQALSDLAQRLKTDLALHASSGALIARAGRALPPPPPDGEGAWLHGPGGPAWSVRLPDRRWVVASARVRHRHPAVGLVLFLGGVAVAVAIGAYPIVRGLTRRLERLQRAVETLGA